MNAFRGVKSVNIRNKDFNGVAVTGLYTYYKPLIKQAKCILSQKYRAYEAENGSVVNKSVFTIPYMINMESLFEFYVRTVLKEVIDSDRYELQKYSKRVYIERNVNSSEDALYGIHMMSYCIPDVIILDKKTREPVCVLDAKYKNNAESERHDSHQLLSYVLLTGVNKCGFIFPGSGENTILKSMRNGASLDIRTRFTESLQYYELIVGNKTDETVIRKLLDGEEKP
jgi:5-methylcytosine-specific restriction endonuclease McrBC regulatory subunit McrC